MRMATRVLVALALLTLSAIPASADTMCAAGSVCTVTLTQTNTTQLIGTVVTVTIDNSGTNTVLSFQVTTSVVTNAPNGIDMVGWNANPPKGTFDTDANSTASTNFGGNLATGPAKGNMDGFGSFNVQGADSAGTGGFTTTITFTLAGLVETFYANSSGNEFAVHVRYQNNCSGFVGGQAGTSSASDAPGCGTTTVPEPASLALFGTGLLGLAGLVRRRFLS